MGVMAYLRSLPGDAVLLDVFRAYPTWSLAIQQATAQFFG